MILTIEFMDGTVKRFNLKYCEYNVTHDGRILQVKSKEKLVPVHIFPLFNIKKITIKTGRGEKIG